MSTTTSIQASADGKILSSTPTTNYGSDTTYILGFESGNEHRILIKFPFSSIPSTHIIRGATLQLTCSVAATADVRGGIENVIGSGIGSPGWVESGLTWRQARSLVLWDDEGGDFDTTADIGFTFPRDVGIVTFDVFKPLKEQRDVRNQANFNIILLRAPTETEENLATFHSSEASTEADRPVLTVVHQVGALRYRGRPPLQRTTAGIGRGV